MFTAFCDVFCMTLYLLHPYFPALKPLKLTFSMSIGLILSMSQLSGLHFDFVEKKAFGSFPANDRCITRYRRVVMEIKSKTYLSDRRFPWQFEECQACALIPTTYYPIFWLSHCTQNIWS